MLCSANSFSAAATPRSEAHSSGRRDVPLPDARLGVDQVHVPLGVLGPEKIVVFDLFRQVDSHGADRGILHH